MIDFQNLKPVLLEGFSEFGLGGFEIELVKLDFNNTFALHLVREIDALPIIRDPKKFDEVLRPIFVRLRESPYVKRIKKDCEEKIMENETKIAALEKELEGLAAYKTYYDKAYELKHGRPE